MLLAYLLLFLLLHLSSSACEATSRNHRLLLPAADVPAPSPSTTTLRHDHHGTITMQHASSFHEFVHARKMMRRQGSPLPGVKLRGSVVEAMPAIVTQQPLGSPRPLPGVKLSDDVEGGNGMPLAEQGNAAAMIMVMAPSPRGDTGGGETGGSSTSEVIVTDDQPEGDVDIGIDYAPPKTHPPSHN